MNIITNNVPRYTVDGYTLTNEERKEFSYMDKETLDCAVFFRYKGNVYHLNEFIHIIARRDTYNGWATQVDNDSPLLAWHGIQSETYFSGLVVKYCDQTSESVIVGRYYS